MKIGDLVKRKPISADRKHRMTTFGLDPKLIGIVVSIKNIMSPAIEKPHKMAKDQLYTITFSNGNTHVFPENFLELISEA